MTKQVSRRDFWVKWLNFLSNETFSQEVENDDSYQGSNTELLKRKQIENGDLSIGLDIIDNTGIVNCYEAIHSRYAPSRRVKDRLFEDHVLVRFL